MHPQIESRLKEFIAANLLYSDTGYPLADDASFLSEGVVDSLGVMELVGFVHKEFGIEVPISDITPQNFDSVGRLGAYVRRRLGAAEAPTLSQEPGLQPLPCLPTESLPPLAN